MEDVIVYMMQKMIYKKVALIDYDQKYQEADLAYISSRQIALIATGKLMPRIEVVRMKKGPGRHYSQESSESRTNSCIGKTDD